LPQTKQQHQRSRQFSTESIKVIAHNSRLTIIAIAFKK